MASPEFPILGAGLITFSAAYARERKFPDNGAAAFVGFAVLLVVVSAFRGSRVEPIVSGLSWLMFLGVLYGAVLNSKKRSK